MWVLWNVTKQGFPNSALYSSEEEALGYATRPHAFGQRRLSSFIRLMTSWPSTFRNAQRVAGLDTVPGKVKALPSVDAHLRR